MPKPSCPCCSQPLLRHVSSRGVYWFCCCCYQEMPTLLTNDPSWHSQLLNRCVVPKDLTYTSTSRR